MSNVPSSDVCGPLPPGGSAAEAADAVSILDATDEAFVRLDGAFRYTFVNRAAENLLGNRRADLLGKVLWEVFPGLVGTPFDENFRRAMTARVPVVFENYYEPWRAWYAITATPDSRGGIVVRTAEITGRKRAEDGLRASTERHRTILQTAMDGFWQADAQGHLLDVNETYCRMSGYSVAELLAMRMPDLAVNDTAENLGAHMKAIMERGEDRFESLHRRKDGSTFAVEVSVQYRPTEGGRFLAFLRDITERKAAQEALRESEETYRALVKGLPDVVMRFDRGGRHLFVSDNVRESVDLDAAEFIGKTHGELGFPEAQCRFWEEGIRRVFNSGAPFETEFSLEGKSGPTIHNWRLVPERDPQGMVRSVLSLARDITARRRAEEKYRMLFHEMLNGFALHEILCDEDGRQLDCRFLAVNPAFERMTGLKGENIVGRTVREVLPGVQEHWVETFGKVAATGEPAIFESYSAHLKKHFEVTAFRSAPNQFACFFADITERKEAQEKLREERRQREAVLADLFEGAPVAYHEFDREGVIRRVNRAECALLGYQAGDMLGRPVWDFIAGADREASRETIRRKLSGEQPPEPLQRRFVRRDGSEVWLEIHNILVRSAAGETIGMRAALLDITERKRAETYREADRQVLGILNEPGDLQDAVQRVLAVLKKLSRCDAIGIRLQDGDDFPYFAQDGFSKDFLLTENTLVERDADGGVCRDKEGGHARLECTCGLVISGGTDRANPLFTQGGSCWTNDSLPLLDLPPAEDPRLHPRNQCVHQGYASVALVPIRSQAGIVGLIHLNDRRKGRFTLDTIELLEGIAAHIGQALMRRRAEEALRESESRFRTLTEDAPTAISMSRQGRVVYANPAYLRMFGFARAEELYNLPTIELFAPECRDQVLELASRRARGLPVSREYEAIGKRAGGSEFPMLVAVIAMQFPEGPALVGFITDLTGSKRAEEARSRLEEQFHQAQKMESVGRLAGGVAHDFNNLLTVINGYSHMLLSDLKPADPIRESIGEICKAGERAAGLTRQLLAFSRKQVLEPRTLDVNRVLEDMRPMLERLVGEDIEVRVALHAGGATIHADPHQLEQVIMNLVVNARDAMPGVGRLLVETGQVERDESYVRSHPEARAGRYVVLAVSDTGVGMDEETKKRIFEPFFTTKGVGQGTGLGLSMVQGIVAQSGGYVEVYSEKGRGTTLKIYLPAVAGAAAAEERAPAVPAEGGTETILVVEDQAEVRKFAVAALKAKGYRVIAAEDAGAALLLCERERIDLVLTDVVMPNVSGRELADRLQALHPGIRVLFMSGYTDNVIEQHGILEVGAQFIQKPFSREELAGKVRAVLGPRAPEARILVADDEAGVRGFLRKVLEQAGYAVTEAADGKQALQHARAGNVDLVITDLVMPEQEGIETIQALRREVPGIGIIAISGAFGGQYLKIAQLMGAAAALNKPLNAALLLAKVAEVLNTRR